MKTLQIQTAEDAVGFFADCRACCFPKSGVRVKVNRVVEAGLEVVESDNTKWTVTFGTLSNFGTAWQREVRASIFTAEQEAELRRLKQHFPFRIVWGCVNVNTQEVTYHADYDRRGINRELRKGNLVATIG